MDDRQKLKLRRKAKIVIGIADLLLLVLLAGSIFRTYWLKGGVHDHNMDLENAKYGVISNFWDYVDQTTREIAVFTPPLNPAEHPAWAEQIQAHLRHPVAVFVRDGGHMIWVSRPAGLEFQDADFEERFDRIEHDAKHPFSSTH